MDFSQRCYEPEKMDGDDFSELEYVRCLSEIERVNNFMGVNSSILKSLFGLGLKEMKEVSLLEVGSGNGGFLRFFEHWARKNGVKTKLIGVDLHPWAEKIAQGQLEKDSKIEFLTQDVFEFSHDINIDFITSSFVTHHMKNEEVIKLICWMNKRARKGWVINDIHRHHLAYRGAQLLMRLLGCGPMTSYDGPLSVRRAFVREDWRQMLSKCKESNWSYGIRWQFPFKYLVLGHKNA